MSGDRDAEDLVAVFEDEHARTILAETSAEPMAASTLAERCGVSESTVYRRIEQLRDQDLLEERMRYRPDGHHHTVYVSLVAAFELVFEDGEMHVELTRRDPPEQDVADRFTDMWEGL